MQWHYGSSFILLLLLLLCKNIPAESNLAGKEVYISSRLQVIGNQSRSQEKSYHTHGPERRETEAGMVNALLASSDTRTPAGKQYHGFQAGSSHTNYGNPESSS